MRTVEKLASGRFKVRFRYDGKQTSETFDKRSEADEFAVWLDAVGVQGALNLLYERDQDKTVPTLDELAAQHFDNLPGVTPGTRLSYERLWARTWSPLIGSVRAHHIDKDQIGKALAVLAQRYSSKSLENQRGLLAGVLGRAIEKEHLAKNIANGIKLPAGRPSRGSDDMRILTPDEFATVEERMSAHFRPLLRFMWGTGCRWGEAVALPVSKVRLPNVSIHQALKWSPDNNRAIGTTKTKKSRRTIVLPAELHDEIAALCDGRRGDELVFTAPKGGPVLHRTFWSRYISGMAKTDLLNQRPKVQPPTLSIAALRKSHKLTQAEVASQIAAITDEPFYSGSLSNIECGDRGASEKILRALEQVFGLQTGDLTVSYEPSHTRRSLKAVASV